MIHIGRALAYHLLGDTLHRFVKAATLDAHVNVLDRDCDRSEIVISPIAGVFEKGILAGQPYNDVVVSLWTGQVVVTGVIREQVPA